MKKTLIAAVAATFVAIIVSANGGSHPLRSMSRERLWHIIDSLNELRLPVSMEPYIAEAKRRARAQHHTADMLRALRTQLHADHERTQSDGTDRIAAEIPEAWSPLREMLYLDMALASPRPDTVWRLALTDTLAALPAQAVADTALCLSGTTAYDYVALQLLGSQRYWANLNADDKPWQLSVITEWEKHAQSPTAETLTRLWRIRAQHSTATHTALLAATDSALQCAAKADCKALCLIAKATLIDGIATADTTSAEACDSLTATATDLFRQARSVANSSQIKEHCQKQIAGIEAEHLTISSEESVAPNTFVPLYIRYRNADRVTIRVFRLSDASKLSRADADTLRSLKPLSETTHHLPNVSGRRNTTSAYVELGGVPYGTYAIASYTADKLKPTSIAIVQSTSIRCFAASADRQITLLVTDAVSGKPLSGAVINNALRTDEHGTATTQRALRSHITVRYAGEKAEFPIEYSPQRAKATMRTCGNIITDRAIYRPGDTIHAKAYLYTATYNGTAAIENSPVEISLVNAHGDKVATAQATTNGFGSAWCKLVMPADIFRGQCRVELSYRKRRIATRYVQTDEYRTTDNALTFDPITERYLSGDTITIYGKCTSANGAAVGGAAVTYAVQCLADTLAADTTYTDASGAFSLRFVSKNADRHYHITATATDQSGETVAAYTTCHISPQGIRTSIAAAYRSDTIAATLTALNTNGEPCATRIQASLYRLERMHGICPQGFSNIDTIIGSTCSLNIDGRLGGYNLEATGLSIDTTVCGTLAVNTLRHLPNGKYLYKCIAIAANGDTLREEASFDVLQPPYDTRHVTEPLVCRAPQICLGGGEATVTVASGIPNATITVWALANGKMIMQQQITEAADINVSVPQSIDGIMCSSVKIIAVCNSLNRCYQTERDITIVHGSRSIDMTLATWRDTSEPGSREEWTVKVRHTQPVEIAAAIYDARTDRLAPNRWTTAMEPLPLYIYTYARDIGIREPPYMLRGTSDWRYWHDYTTDLNAATSLTVPPYQPLAPRFAFGERIYSKQTAGRIMGARNRIAIEESMVADADFASPVAEAAFATTPEATAEATPQPTLRTDFRQTVFFYPSVICDTTATIAFTLPDDITAYNIKLLAHDKLMRSGYIERTLNVTKQLRVKGGVPRFGTQGDTIAITADIRSLQAQHKAAQCTLTMRNARSGEVLYQSQTVATAIDTLSSRAEWLIAVPAASDTLHIDISAATGSHTDGERHTLIVKPRHITATQSEPFILLGKGEKVLEMPFGKTEGMVELTYTPNTYGHILMSLPTISRQGSPSSECHLMRAEAYGIAHRLSQMEGVRAMTDGWRAAPPAVSIDNSAPWAAQQRDINQHIAEVTELLNGDKARPQMQHAIRQLAAMQLADGSFPWFKGMKGSEYITCHILSTLGRMVRYGVAEGNSPHIERMSRKASAYLTGRIAADLRRIAADTTGKALPTEQSIEALYALSLTGTSNATTQALADTLARHWQQYSHSAKISAATALCFYNHMAEARIITQSLTENLVVAYGNTTAHIASRHTDIGTNARLLMLLNLLTPDAEAKQQVTNWLVMQRRGQWWGNSQSTSEAILALLDACATTPATDIVTWGNTTAAAGPSNMEISLVASADTAAQQATVNKRSELPTWGAWSHTAYSPIDSIEPHSNDDISIRRELTVMRHGQAIPASKAQLRVGDKVTVRLTVQCRNALSFVRITDNRPAALEPTDGTSHYRWSWRALQLPHYYMPTDTQVDIFVEHMPAGTHTLSYDATITNSGRMLSGIATATCTFAPEITAHTGAFTLEAKGLNE